MPLSREIQRLRGSLKSNRVASRRSVLAIGFTAGDCSLRRQGNAAFFAYSCVFAFCGSVLFVYLLLVRVVYKYRLYPNQALVRFLENRLHEACELFNAALQERRDGWKV